GGTINPSTWVGCTDINGNPSYIYRVSWDPLRPHDGVRCVLSPAKPKGYIPINETVPEWFAPPQCDKLDGAEYIVGVNRAWAKHQQPLASRSFPPHSAGLAV